MEIAKLPCSSITDQNGIKLGIVPKQFVKISDLAVVAVHSNNKVHLAISPGPISLIKYHRPALSQTSQFTILANAPYRQKYETFQNIKSKDILYNGHTPCLWRGWTFCLCGQIFRNILQQKLQQAIGEKLLYTSFGYIQI